MPPIESILDTARWAPSGDNEQPWRFEVISDQQVVIHIRNRYHSVFDLDHHATYIAAGTLLETIRIAATDFGWGMTYDLVAPQGGDLLTINVQFASNPGITRSDLLDHVRTRMTARGLYKPQRLRTDLKQKLASAFGDHLTVQWHEGTKIIRLLPILWKAEAIRLFTPEIFENYQTTIDWQGRHSPDHLTLNTLGLNPVSQFFYKVMMKTRRRFVNFNKFMGGRFFAFFELDVMPHLFCGAVFSLHRLQPITSPADVVKIGSSLQRFWLTATQCGLLHQPNYLLVAMNTYVRTNRSFSQDQAMGKKAVMLREGLGTILSEQLCDSMVWVGRIGYGRPPRARSGRLDYRQLIQSKR